MVEPEEIAFGADPEWIKVRDESVARGGQIVLVSDADASSAGCAIRTYLKVPALHRFVTPLVYALPVQLIAYHTAVFMGTDVDQPRNLAKSVTVE